VDDVARGRVWTGQAAADLGLVDQLGGLDGAVAAAAQRAGLERYELVWPAARLSPSQRLMRRLSAVAGLDERPRAEATSAFGRLLGQLEASAAELLRWNDRDHLYAHCLCEAP
jgi:protease IV